MRFGLACSTEQTLMQGGFMKFHQAVLAERLTPPFMQLCVQIAWELLLIVVHAALAVTTVDECTIHAEPLFVRDRRSRCHVYAVAPAVTGELDVDVGTRRSRFHPGLALQSGEHKRPI